MGSINLYKIEKEKKDEFIRMLATKLEIKNTIDSAFGESEQISLTLYTDSSPRENNLSWNWILREFEHPAMITHSSPKAVVLAEKEDDTTYAVTFGSAFFIVDKYCDKDFGFQFARKLSFDEIKTTTLTTPNSRRNKTVSTYVNYNQLEFDSGESFAKLKAKVDVDENFTMFKPSVEIGTSIKITTEIETLKNISNIIYYIEDKITNGKEKCKIPVFVKIKDKEYIDSLNEKMQFEVKENPEIVISELEIIGSDEIFNHNDDEYVVKFKGKTKKVTSLTVRELKGFCTEYGFNYCDVVLDIKICRCYNGEPVSTKTIKELVEYIDDDEKCLLSKGEWYKFNDDYLNYLSSSIAEISVEYHPEYDFSETIHDLFVDEMFEKEKTSSDYKGKTDDKIKKSLKRKYYAERAFNILRSREGFRNFDRENTAVGDANIEAMDLYKDGYAFAVKIGNSSGKLCYAIDQSLTALKLYKQGELTDIPEITTVALWFVLERKKHIENKNGVPDLNKLEMLMLKNRIDQWKKEVRLLGYKPLIYINYRTI